MDRRDETSVSVDLILPDLSSEQKSRQESTSTRAVNTPDTDEGTTTVLTTQTPTSTSTTSSALSKSTGRSEIESSISSVKIIVTTSTATPQPSSSITTDETPIFDSTPDLNPQPTAITVIPDLMTNLPTANPNANEHLLYFKHPIYTAMLPEGQYGNRGAFVNLRPSPLREVSVNRAEEIAILNN